MIKVLDQETIKKWETEHVLYPWSTQSELDPIVLESASGNYFYDSVGKKYLDFSSMFVFANLGHGNKRVLDSISNQAKKLAISICPFATEPKARLAKLLADLTPGDIKKTFFTTSGSEANDAAIKITRLATGKEKIVSRYRSYHGSTFGAMSLGNNYRNWAYEPCLPSIIHCLSPYCYRCSFGLTQSNCDLQCAKHVEEIVRLEGGAKRVGGFIAETITGIDGIIVPPNGYWKKIREICDRYEMLMICDEVMTGFGRTGKWFAIEHWGVIPDIITMAKGITGGYIPLGATSVREKVSKVLDTIPFEHGHTYSGHVLAMTAGVSAIEVYQTDGLINRAACMGKYLIEKAKELKDKHPCVGDVRGKGLMVGIELVKNRKTKEPLHDPLVETHRCPTAKMRVLSEALKEGVYCLSGVASVIMLAPPLTITKEEINFAMEVFDKVLKIADKETKRY